MQEQHDLAKWLAGEMTEAELQAFRNTPEFNTYERIAARTTTMQTPDFKENKILDAIMNRQKSESKIIQLSRKILFRVAAVLVIAIGLGYFFTSSHVSTQIAEAGRKTEFALPDASLVTLNSDSEINYKEWNWNNNRCLDLRGEAFFRVAKGKTFDVNTALGKVTVVGTQFNVNARDNRFEVECFEGKVRVAFNGQVILLTKGQIVIAENGQILPANATPAAVPYWMNRQIRFESSGLRAIIAEIERQYAVKVEQKGLSSRQNFTGILPANDLDKALRILSKPYHLKFTTLKNKVILSVDE